MKECKVSELVNGCNHGLVLGDEATKASITQKVSMDLGGEWDE